MNKKGGSIWRKKDLHKLKKLYNEGRSINEISESIGRTYPSVDAKIQRLKKSGEIPRSVIPPSFYPKYDKPLQSEGDALVLTDIEAPFQDSEFLNRCLDLADAWGVRDIHFAGDLLHYDTLSKWGSEWIEDKQAIADIIFEVLESQKQIDKAREELERRGLLAQDDLSSELAEARAVFRSFKSFQNKYVSLGNHDDRYLRALDKALSPRELLRQIDRQDDPTWKIAPYYYSFIDTEQGRFRATHPRGAGVNAARDLAVQFHQHIIMGHSHRWAVQRDPSGDFWAIQTGHCVDEERLAYVMQRDAKRDAHVKGATLIRGGFPFVLCPETPWDIMKRM